jgi:prepilin-type processing-associated H-X9-DG protein
MQPRQLGSELLPSYSIYATTDGRHGIKIEHLTCAKLVHTSPYCNYIYIHSVIMPLEMYFSGSHTLYAPLPKDGGFIRLITLKPAPRFSSQIECYMCSLPVYSIPKIPYVALSYCWGDASNPVTIKVNNRPLAVTQNLYLALLRIRKEWAPVDLWVDAICINQEDMIERSHQVMMMKDIYQRAHSTIVWLGEAAQHSSMAFGLIKAWANGANDLDMFVKECPFAFKKQMWQALFKLVERPWFTRVWVYQEYVVSKNIVFLCGPDTMTFGVFSYGRAVWKHVAAHNLPVGVGKEHIGLLVRAELKQMQRLDFLKETYVKRQEAKKKNEHLEGERTPDLPFLLHLTGNLDATDSRDKLYALLGLDEVRDITIVPRYDLPVSQVWINYATEYIRSRQSLEILGRTGIGLPNRDPQLPSWVPDLCSTYNSCSSPILGRDPTNFLYADGHSAARCRVDDSHKSLTVIGFTCTTVTQLSPGGDDNSTSRYQSMANLALSSPHDHPAGVSKTQALFQTLNRGDCSRKRGQPDYDEAAERAVFSDLARGFMVIFGNFALEDLQESNPRAYRQWNVLLLVRRHNYCSIYLHVLLGSNPAELHFKTDEELLQPFLTSSKANVSLNWEFPRLSLEDELRLAMQFLQKSLQSMEDLCFFLTEEGYIGIGPPLMESGDRVCIVFGCPYPVILRKVENDSGYRLVGDAYIYGMMQGEMISKFHAGDFAEEQFVLR